MKDFGVIKEDEEHAEVSGSFEVFKPFFFTNILRGEINLPKVISNSVPINVLKRRKYENHIDQSHCSRTQ